MAVGAPGAPASELGTTVEDSGAVFVFERAGGTWSEVARLEPSQPRELNFYGLSVALHEGSLLVGERGGGTVPPYTGSAHVYSRIASGWVETQPELLASNGESNDFYGSAVDITGTHIVVGANGEASDSPGIDGDASSNATPQAGAVYYYRR